MSIDLQIDQVCTHQVVQEALFLDADRKTVRPQRPIASIGSLAIRLDGSINVPPMGVTIPAQAVGSLAGPFTITSGVNDTIAVQVNQGAAQTITLSSATGLSTANLALLLNQQAQGIYFQALGNQLLFRTTTAGPQSSVFFTAASTMAPTLGFKTIRQFRGQQLVPGWFVINDPTSITIPNRLIVFDSPLRSATDFVEINYTTQQIYCRRCGGTGVEDDWRYDNTGQKITVQDDNLLIQELQKDFFTILGTNPFHTWYGTDLIDTIGKKLTMGGFVQNLIVSDIYQAFSRWQQIKQQQEEKVGQFVSDKEYPYRLLSVNLQQSTQDSTVIFVSVNVQNRSRDPIQITQGLKIPLPADLLGSTQQMGLIRQSLLGYVQES